MRAFIEMPEDRRRLVCEQVGAQSGLFDSSVEKDFWVSWTLEKLFSLPELGETLTFKGGTSLSKGWKLIERFSEDIDIVIDRTALGFGGDQSPDQAQSKKQTKKRLDSLKSAAQAYISEHIQPALHAAIQADLPTAREWSLEPDPDDPDQQTLLFNYPTAFPAPPEYLPQRVKIEMGARSDTDPSSEVEIEAIISETFPSLIPDSQFTVRTVQPIRTFWEKAMLLHEESFKPSTKSRKRGMARHYYDVYKLIDQGVATEASTDKELFNRIAAHRRTYFRYTWMDYDTLTLDTLNMLPREDQMADWRADYSGMQQEMFYGEVPDFDSVLVTIQQFQKALNGRSS